MREEMGKIVAHWPWWNGTHTYILPAAHFLEEAPSGLVGEVYWEIHYGTTALRSP
jgi:hypothetical protein